MAGRHRHISAVAVVGLIALLAGACGGGGSARNVSATEKDFSIALDKTSIKSGEVTFEIKNDGPSAHEFVVFKTDLAADQLPTKQENGVPIVDEEGAGVEAIDEVEDINPGDTPELKVTLQPGSYVAICNLPAHYQQGMHVAFTVTS